MQTDRAWLIGLMLPGAAMFVAFFAIPLATLVKAVLNAWPKRDDLPRPAP